METRVALAALGEQVDMDGFPFGGKHTATSLGGRPSCEFDEDGGPALAGYVPFDGAKGGPDDGPVRSESADRYALKLFRVEPLHRCHLCIVDQVLALRA